MQKESDRGRGAWSRGIRIAASIALLGLVPLPAPAQFRPLRFDDDFAAQRTHCDEGDAIACWKARPLGEGATLSVGGEVRWRYEYTHNPELGDTEQDPYGVISQRYSAFADLRGGGWTRLFVQLTDTEAVGREGGSSPVDESGVEANNLFLELAHAEGAVQPGLRYGIQELRLGSARLVDVRDGPNVRRSFFGTRGFLRPGNWRLDAFDVKPRDTLPGDFDDRSSNEQRLTGVYATRAADDAGLDLYALDYRDRAAGFVQGSGDERRWSVGARSYGSKGRWDWNWEAVWQGGHFDAPLDAGNDRQDIRAWTLATETGYAWPDAKGGPRLSWLMAIASGDDGNDGRLGTFNPMYPRGSYFGEEATLGPLNFYNFQPTLAFSPADAWKLELSVDAFYRQNLDDGVYAPNGRIIRAPDGSRARHVATILSVNACWCPRDSVEVTLVGSYLSPGRFMKETGPHEALGYLELTGTYRF